MILWHLGMTVLAVRYVFRDPAMDLRWVLVGSLLPDLVDKPIGAILFHDTFGTDRLVGHSVVFPVVMLFVVLGATRRGSGLRRGLIGLVIGSLLHLVLDAAWADPEAFWWPFFGFDFPMRPDSAFPELVRRMVTDPWVWAGEAVGLAYLVGLWRTQLAGSWGLRGFLRTGRVPMPRA
ncbi:MAG: metal-dependent hydrolase [Acidimicrobiia bacterium]|nr:metal-dependent hydrolase [Acidimicrobiia bacterium]